MRLHEILHSAFTEVAVSIARRIPFVLFEFLCSKYTCNSNHAIYIQQTEQRNRCENA